MDCLNLGLRFPLREASSAVLVCEIVGRMGLGVKASDDWADSMRCVRPNRTIFRRVNTVFSIVIELLLPFCVLLMSFVGAAPVLPEALYEEVICGVMVGW